MQLKSSGGLTTLSSVSCLCETMIKLATLAFWRKMALCVSISLILGCGTGAASSDGQDTTSPDSATDAGVSTDLGPDDLGPVDGGADSPEAAEDTGEDAGSTVPDTSVDAPDSTDVRDPDGGTATFCDVATIRCTQDGDEISFIQMQVGRSEFARCRLESPVEPPTSGLVRWVWRLESRADFEFRSVAYEQESVFFPAFAGEGAIVAQLDTCEVVGPEFSVAPTEGVLDVAVSWESSEGDVLTPDVDLHVLQSGGACWGDRLQDLHFGSPETLDWGVLGFDDDNPRRGGDGRGTVGREYAAAMAIGEGEQWWILVDVSPSELSPVNVRVDVTGNGSFYWSGVRSFDSDRVWSIGVMSEERFATLDALRDTPPACSPDLCANGEPSAPETCNGIDDDCDGSIDESPETCINDGRDSNQVCVEARGRFACVDF